MPPITYGKALYYPHITFPDVKWLKTAALYYDSLDRIVPAGFHLHKESRIAQDLKQSGFINDIDPASKIDEVAKDFIPFAGKHLLKKKRRSKLADQLKITADQLKAALQNEHPFSIYSAKLSPGLRKILTDLNLAQPYTLQGDEDAYEFEPLTGAIYMTFLAHRLAAEQDLPVVTDNPLFQPLINGVEAVKNKTPEDKGMALASLVIGSAVPMDMERVSIKQILHFREHYKGERLRFYDEIEKTVADLDNVTNQATLKKVLEHRKEKIEEAVSDLDGVLRGMRITTRIGLLSLSVPSIALAAGFPVSGIIASVGLVAAGKIVSGKLSYDSKKKSPYAYVLSLGENLDQEGIIRQLLKGKVIL